MVIFETKQLIEAQLARGGRWEEFLRAADLSAGHYLLPAGGRDEQQPHSEDEIYLVQKGKGILHVDGEEQPVGPGALVYVPAHAVHYFHTITADLHLLVIFGPAEGSRKERLQVVETAGSEISTDPSRLDFELIHHYLAAESYWAAGISRERLARAIANSLCFGIYRSGEQIAFGRLVTDFATLAYVSDVFVIPGSRGEGLGRALLSAMLSHPEVQGLRKWILHTRDAHEFYRRFGFKRFDQVPSYMEYRP